MCKLHFAPLNYHHLQLDHPLVLITCNGAPNGPTGAHCTLMNLSSFSTQPILILMLGIMVLTPILSQTTPPPSLSLSHVMLYDSQLIWLKYRWRYRGSTKIRWFYIYIKSEIRCMYAVYWISNAQWPYILATNQFKQMICILNSTIIILHHSFALIVCLSVRQKIITFDK